MTDNTQDTSDSHSRPQIQVCPLCAMWTRMPYAKRWSTPTSVHDTESALIIGFWLGIQYRTPEILCEKHRLLIEHLNCNPSQLAPQIQPYASVSSQLPTGPREFKLGPEPFTNENVILQSPPAQPNSAISAQPTTGQIPTVDPVKHAINASLRAPIDFTQLAIDAAKMPPVEGKRITFCPVCGKEVAIGEVHSCSG